MFKVNHRNVTGHCGLKLFGRHFWSISEALFVCLCNTSDEKGLPSNALAAMHTCTFQSWFHTKAKSMKEKGISLMTHRFNGWTPQSSWRQPQNTSKSSLSFTKIEIIPTPPSLHTHTHSLQVPSYRPYRTCPEFHFLMKKQLLMNSSGGF